MWKVVDSNETYKRFYALVAEHVGVGEGVTVEVINMIRNPIPDPEVTLPDPDPQPVDIKKPLDPDVSTTLWEDMAFKFREWLRGRTELIPKLPSRMDLYIVGAIVVLIIVAAIMIRGC